jgi:phosphoenolpyruvate---glycerone phosphotransferase subunit DhaL
MDETALKATILSVAAAVNAHADELTALDSAIGDGDHGANMKRGFDAVAADVDTISANGLPDALIKIGTKLVMTIGGASGPLYGTLFLTLGKQLAARPGDYVGALLQAVDAVAARGKSELGQKTMLDVLYPVAHAFRDGKSKSEILAVAEREAAATKDRRAIRGRASFLGERSIGHIDPGARSSALIVEAIGETLP